MTSESNAPKRRVPREVWTLVIGAAAVLLGFIAIPRILDSGDYGPHEAEIVPLPSGAAPPAQVPGAGAGTGTSTGTSPGTLPGTRPGTTGTRGTAKVPAAGPKAAMKDGDLVLEVKLRWPKAAAGTTLPGTVHLTNTGQATFHLPAPGEPHPTLALIVLDAEGRVVRRIVETSTSAYPQRTLLVGPAQAMDLPVVVVAGDDQALPPGEYTVFAEMRHDPVWDRLGLPMWKEPQGAARSRQEPFTITAKTE